MKKKELIRFIVSGCLAMSTDLAIYFTLKNYFSTSISKGISFIFGTTVAYLLNKYWTFEVKEKSYKEMMRFFSLYGFSMIINVSVNKIVLTIFPDIYFVNKVVLIFFSDFYIFAFLCASVSSAVLNFAGQKFWVFKEMKIS